MLESVVYLSNRTIDILEKLRNIPESKWGATAFIKQEGGPDFRKTSGAATDGKERFETGKYLPKKYIDDYIDKILKKHGEYIRGNKNIFIDLELVDNKIVANVITDGLYKSMLKKGTLDGYDFSDKFLDGDGDKDGAIKLKTLYDNEKLKEITKIGRAINGLKIESGKGANFDKVIIEELAKKIHTYLLDGKFEEDKNRMDMVLKEVKGNDIIFWYNGDNYVDSEMFGDSEQSLSGSCMRHDSCSTFFDIYVMNPEQVSMLVYYDNDSKKLFGRALIWTNEDGDRRMDKIYAVNVSTRHLFREYKEKNCNANFRDLELDIVEFDEYPYMDTFQYINTETKEIATYDNDGKVATSTSGYLDDSGIWSEHEEGYIPEDDAIYLNYMSDFVRYDDVVRIEQYDNDDYALEEDAVEINGDYYHKMDDQLVPLSEYYYNYDEYGTFDNTLTETQYDTFININDAKYYIDDIELDDEDIYYSLGVVHEDADYFDETFINLNNEEESFNKNILSIFETLFSDDILVKSSSVDNHIEDTYDNYRDEIIPNIKITKIALDDEIVLDKILAKILNISDYIKDSKGNLLFSKYNKDSEEIELFDGNDILRLLMYLSKGNTINNVNIDDIYPEEEYPKLYEIISKLSDIDEETFNIVYGYLSEEKEEY